MRTLDEYPGFDRFPAFLHRAIDARRIGSVLDLGGGARPMVDWPATRLAHYDLLDIDPREIQKATSGYSCAIRADACGPLSAIDAQNGGRRYDMVFSHMLLEHVADPDALHRNVHELLRPGGIAVHAYACRYNLPLFVNSIVPESVSHRLLKAFMPRRNLEGRAGKFPAWYLRCQPPRPALTKYFTSFGYTLLLHEGFVGHSYYSEIPVLRELERRGRSVLVGLGIPLVSLLLVVLAKDEGGS